MEAKEQPFEFKAGMFAAIVGDGLEADGLSDGSYVYLAGDTFIRETEEDPYLFRRAFIAAQVVNYHIQVEEKPFLITAKDLDDVGEVALAALTETYEEDFKGEDDE